MKTNRTYNPCDDCQYSYSKTGEESSMCKICEFMYFRFRDLASKHGKWEHCLSTPGGINDRYKCTSCGFTTGWTTNCCGGCGAKMKVD